MLLETIEQSRKIPFRTKLYRMDICYCGGLSMICQNCGFFLAPLAAAPHYMNIDIEDYPLGNHFLVLGQHAMPSLTINNQNALFHTEAPFLYMFLESVNCASCD